MISNVAQQNFTGTVDTSNKEKKKKNPVKVGAIAGAAVAAADIGIKCISIKGTPAGALVGSAAKAQPGKFALVLGSSLVKNVAIAAAIGAGIGKIVDVIRNKKAQKNDQDVRSFQA